MQRLPSASVRYAPAADSTKGGAPPTARKARTGEFTPPGKKRSARCWRAWERVRVGKGICELIMVSIEGRRAGGQVALWRAWSFIERCQRIAFLSFISGSEPQD